MDGNIILNQRLLSQEVRNVLAVSNIPTDSTGRDDFLNAFEGLWGTIFNLPSTNWIDVWQLYSITFSYVDDTGPPTFSVEAPLPSGPIVGDVASTTSTVGSTQTALLLSLVSNTAPPNRGRVYIAGITNVAINSSGLYTQGVRDDAQDFFQEWATTGISGTFLRIARKNSAGRIIASSAVEQVLARPVPATQRRRRIGQGI